MRIRIAQTLTDRAIATAEMLHALNREIVPILRQVLRALTASPGLLVWEAGAASLDLRTGRDFMSVVDLTQDSTLALVGGLDGSSGTIWVQQDAVGGRLLSITADSRTLVRLSPDVDDNPNPAALSMTQYDYAYMTLGGTPYVVIQRHYLL